MQRTQYALASLIKFGACAILALGAVAQAQDKKVDPNGSWTWSTPGRNGGQARETTLKLKTQGDKVTGTISGRGRQGAAATDTPIGDATLKGDTIAFTVTREVNGNKMVAKYSGKISGDTIKGKMDTERNGEPVSRDWEAKRGAAKE